MPRICSVSPTCLPACLIILLYLTGAAPAAQAANFSGGAQAANVSGGAQAANELPGRQGADSDADTAPPASVRLDTPSGLPVPRMVSLKAEKTFCRSGPSFAHPVRLTFMRQGLPVIVVAETRDHWRKIRDTEGDECWTHKSKLSGQETALVLEDGLALRARPNAGAPARARLGRGVIAHVDGARGRWLKVSADGRKGWARASAFWGARADAPLAVYPQP